MKPIFVHFAVTDIVIIILTLSPHLSFVSSFLFSPLRFFPRLLLNPHLCLEVSVQNRKPTFMKMVVAFYYLI